MFGREGKRSAARVATMPPSVSFSSWILSLVSKNMFFFLIFGMVLFWYRRKMKVKLSCEIKKKKKLPSKLMFASLVLHLSFGQSVLWGMEVFYVVLVFVVEFLYGFVFFSYHFRLRSVFVTAFVLVFVFWR